MRHEKKRHGEALVPLDNPGVQTRLPLAWQHGH